MRRHPGRSLADDFPGDGLEPNHRLTVAVDNRHGALCPFAGTIGVVSLRIGRRPVQPSDQSWIGPLRLGAAGRVTPSVRFALVQAPGDDPLGVDAD
jgi:hypothetical protein